MVIENGKRVWLSFIWKQFCENISKKEVHDLGNETVMCQIYEIIKAGHAISFDTLQEAKAKSYDNCVCCISGSP